MDMFQIRLPPDIVTDATREIAFHNEVAYGHVRVKLNRVPIEID